MRMSELRGLRWGDVDFERSVIQVRQRADHFNEICKPKIKSSRRDIPMAPSVKKVLMARKADCLKGELDLVFPNGIGNVESPSNISNRVLYPLLIDAGTTNTEGKPKFSFHALRHAAASLFIEQGWPANMHNHQAFGRPPKYADGIPNVASLRDESRREEWSKTFPE